MDTLRFLVTNFRWLSVGILLTFLSSFGQTYFISVFSGEIREAFDLSHAAWGLTYTLGTGASAAVMLWSGALTDLYRTRALSVIVLTFLACACLAMAFNPWAGALPLVIFMLRLGGQGMMGHLAAVSMARWFVGSRGRALSISGFGYALGEALLPLIIVSLLLVVDWHLIWVAAALIALLAIPLLQILLNQERTPQSHAETDISFGMDQRHWTRMEALRHPLFWLMVPALLGPPAFGTAFFFQQVHFASVKGWKHVELVALFPLYTATVFTAMMTSGWLLDRFGTARVIPFYQIPAILAFAVLATCDTLPQALFGLILLGMTTGSNATLPNAFWAEFYGTKSLGAIKATATSVMVLGSALGPGITGSLIDLGIGIQRQYMGVAVFFVFVTACMWIGVSRSKGRL